MAATCLSVFVAFIQKKLKIQMWGPSITMVYDTYNIYST